jgi:hypothetical protein
MLDQRHLAGPQVASLILGFRGTPLPFCRVSDLRADGVQHIVHRRPSPANFLLP